MELVHEPGCDQRHTARQRCNVPYREGREQLYIWEPSIPLRHAVSAASTPSSPFIISRAKARRAILLELVPVFALVFAASMSLPALLEHDIAGGASFVRGFVLISWLIALVPFIVSGMGWMYAGHWRLGATLMVLRGAIVFVTLLSALVLILESGYCDGCPDTSEVAWLYSWLAISVLTPVASAVSIAIIARRDGAAVAPPDEPREPLFRQLGFLTVLELLPVVPGALFVARIVLIVSGEVGPTSHVWFGPFTTVALGLAFLASGLGWLAARRVSIALALGLMRALLLAVLLIAVLFTGGCLYRTSCDKGIDAFAAAVLIALGLVAVSAPCASAYFLVTSEMRRVRLSTAGAAA